MKTIIAFVLFVFPLFASAGIFGGDKTVERVKEMVLPFDQTLTLGQAVETNPVCIKHNWESSTDKRGRVQIKHTCELSPLWVSLQNEYAHAGMNKKITDDSNKLRLDMDFRMPDRTRTDPGYAALDRWEESVHSKVADYQVTGGEMVNIYGLDNNGDLVPVSMTLNTVSNQDLEVTSFKLSPNDAMVAWYADQPDNSLPRYFLMWAPTQMINHLYKLNPVKFN